MLLWLLVPLFCLCSLSSLVAYGLAEHFANDSYDKLLVRSAESIVGRIGRNESGVVVADLPLAAQAILRHETKDGLKDQFYYQIADSYGHRLTGDAVLPLPLNTSDKGPRFRYAEIAGQKVRMYRVYVQISPSPDEIWVQVAETLNCRQQLLKQIFISIVAPQVVLVILASLSVWVGVKHGVAPLERLGKLLNARRKVDLSPVDIGKTPSELVPVTNALNQLFLNATNHIQLQRQFIGNAAHQLRTPITALKTNSEYALRIASSGGATLSEVLEQTSEAATRLAHMTERLLSLARTEEESVRILEKMDISEAVNDAAALVVSEALRRNICMEFEIPESPVYVNGDRGDLVELLANLFDNAIKYTSEKGAIWVKLQETTDAVIINIEDNGPGIPDPEKQSIFERFYRIPGTTEPGCGLGLSIVSRIASNNNATVKVIDRPGGGACFCITFPRLNEALGETVTDKSSELFIASGEPHEPQHCRQQWSS